MRPPTPPLFQRRGTLFSRLIGWLDQPTRIILRQVSRRPLRAFAHEPRRGDVGRGTRHRAAVARRDRPTRSTTSFSGSSTRTSRSDSSKRPRDVVGSVGRLPGVLAVEARRAVAARLTHEQYTRREAIIGIPAEGQLESLHTNDGTEVRVPTSGLLLSSALADRSSTPTSATSSPSTYSMAVASTSTCRSRRFSIPTSARPRT